MNKKEIKIFVSEKKDINEKERTITHYISSSAVDRHGDIVQASGMVNTNYLKNPVVLWAHGGGWLASEEPLPIAKSLWQRIEGDYVLAKTQFATHRLAEDVYNLNKDGFLNSWSIGFMPINAGYETIDGEEIYVYRKWDLLEYSSVPIPANPDALNNAFKMVKSREVIDAMQKGFLSTQLEMLSKSIFTKEMAEELIKTNTFDPRPLETMITELKDNVSNFETSLKISDEIVNGFNTKIQNIETLLNNHKTWVNDRFLEIAGKLNSISNSVVTPESVEKQISGAIRRHIGKLD